MSETHGERRLAVHGHGVGAGAVGVARALITLLAREDPDLPALGGQGKDGEAGDDKHCLFHRKLLEKG
jgi:hypothetical protein